MAIQYNKTNSKFFVKKWDPEDGNVTVWFVNLLDQSSGLCNEFIAAWKSGVPLYDFAGVAENGDDIQGAVIPCNLDNRDYQQFLKDWEAGAEVLNSDGTPAPYSEAAETALTAA